MRLPTRAILIAVAAVFAVAAYDIAEFNHGMSVLSEHQEQQDRRKTHYGACLLNQQLFNNELPRTKTSH